MKTIPLYALLAVMLLFLIPIFSIEGISPWIIFFYFSYLILKLSRNKDMANNIKYKKLLMCFFFAVLLGVMYNLSCSEGTAFVMKLI